MGVSDVGVVYAGVIGCASNVKMRMEQWRKIEEEAKMEEESEPKMARASVKRVCGAKIKKGSGLSHAMVTIAEEEEEGERGREERGEGGGSKPRAKPTKPCAKVETDL